LRRNRSKYHAISTARCGLSTVWNKLTNSAWAILEYVWNPVLLLICTPLFLKALGSERYGLWMLLVATVGFGAILNAGTGAATIKHVSAEIGEANSHQLQRVIQGSLAIAITGGGLLALTIVCAFWFGDDFFFERMGDRHLLHITGLAAGTITWIEQLDNVFASALRGSERYGLAAKTEIGAKSLQVLALALSLLAGAGLMTVYVIIFIVAVARLGTKFFVTRRVLKVSEAYPRFAHVKELLHFSKWAWIQGLGGTAFNSSDRFAVASLLGATSLAQYSVVTQLAMQIHGLTAAGVSVVFPMISRKRARNPSFPIARATVKIFIANAALSTSIAVVLLVFGKFVLRLWLGAQMPANAAILLDYLVIAYWLLALNITPYYVLLGLGQVRIIAIWVFIGGAAGLIPMIYGISRFGLIGAGAGKLIYAAATLMLFVPLGQILLREKLARNIPRA
jgi:O-antigen/teichoic acid export membrane protein